MFEGYVSFAGQELINVARVQTYVDEGFVPQGVVVEPCVSCETLPEALGQPGGYNTPLVDQPPWFDTEHPESADFAGLVPLGITGLRGSTRTVEVVERAGDGGVPLPGRWASRTIAVSAMAIARTAGGLDAGLTWLSSALHPPCATLMPGCGGGDLDLFSTCPVTCDGQTDPDSPMLNFPIPATGDWRGSGGTASHATATATNRVTNPSFEVDTAGWTPTTGTTVARSLAVRWVGSASALLTKTGTPGSIGMSTATGAGGFAVVAGASYQSWIRVQRLTWGATPGKVSVTITFYTAAGAVIGTPTTLPQMPLVSGTGTPEWVIAGGAVDAPATAAFASMTVAVDSAEVGNAAYVDGAFFTEYASAYTYFDGDTPDIGTTDVFSWTGTPHASTSTAVTDEGQFVTLDPARPGLWLGPVQPGICDDVTYVWRVRRTPAGTATVTNYVQNPSAEVSLGPDDGGNVWQSASSAVSQSTDQALVGASSVKAEWGATPSPALLGVTTVIAGRTYNGSLSVFVPPGDPDVVFTVTGAANAGGTSTVTVSTKGEWVRVNLSFVAQPPLATGTQWDQVTPPSTEWDQLDPTLTWDTFDATTPLPGTVLSVASVGPTGGVCYIDGAQVTEGALVQDYFDGDSADTADTTYAWTGTPGLSTSTRVGVGPITVQPVLTDVPGVIQEFGAEASVAGEVTTVTMTVPMTPGFPADYRPGLLVQGGQMVSGNLALIHRHVLTVEECIADLRRSLHGVVTIEGPTVVEEFADADGDVAMARVEWTWVATRPFVYADPVPMFTRVPYSGSGAGDFVSPGVSVGPSAEVTQAATSCPLPAAVLSSCADYPCCTPLALPPTAPSVPETCVPGIGSANYVRRLYSITPSAVPAGVGVLNMAFEAVGKAVVGVRVRLWQTDESGTVAAECGFVNEWWIDFIPAEGVLVIDARAGTLETYCAGTFRPAGRVVKGPYRSAFEFPQVGCNHQYVLAVDVPKTYAPVAGCLDPAGAQGTLYASASMVQREG